MSNESLYDLTFVDNHGQQVDVERCMTEVGTREPFKPVPDLRLKLHRTPRHTNDDITASGAERGSPQAQIARYRATSCR